MIRTGIYNLNQLCPSNLKDVFGKEKNISIYLYQKLSQIENPEKKVLYAEMILNRFNSARNVIKRTSINRFNKFDDASVAKISEQKYNKISILDVAISDGRASCYLLEQSIRHLKDFSYEGSDIQINYFLNRKKANSSSYIITDQNKKIVEIVHTPFVWNLARTEGQFYFISNIMKLYFLRRAQTDLYNNKYKYQEKIELINHDFKSLLAKSPRYRLSNYNLFEKIPEKYTVFRAMNILHQGYFRKDQLLLIINNIYNGLEINGLLIEGSNEEAGTPVEGAIYRKSEKGFTLIFQPEMPSRIEEQVLNFRPASLNEG